jgi:DNA invertase Pin-like site-specific DNA recombinase
MKKNNVAFEHLLQTISVSRYAKQVIRNKNCGVIYTRVSSHEQQNNSSLSTQKKLCEEYAQRNGIEIKGYFGGIFESAKTDGRKEFQRMLSYIKKDKEVSFIIVINFDRFSRTGPAAANLSASLRKQGIFIKAVLQDIDTKTASGRLQENVFHVFNHFDNETKSERTKVNTREVMLKGYWPYATPLGYKNLKPKHRAYEHQYVITEEGKLLKKAFELKAAGALTNKQICQRLSVKGLRLTVKNFRWIMSNSFYAGYVTGSLVDGKLIKGQHPPLVDLKTFLRANDLLKKATNVGVAKNAKRDDLPLKVYAKEEASKSPLTGYIKKGNWYYKARAKGVGVNISAKKLNAHFEELLKQFEYNKKHKEKLRAIISKRLKERLQAQLEDSIQLKKKLTELQGQLEKIEERFILDEIKAPLYEKYKDKYSRQIREMKAELEKNSFDTSNLDLAVKKILAIAENVSQQWVLAEYDEKQKLQYLIFPEGIVYNKEKDSVRTQRVNSLFAEIPLLTQDLEEKKKGNPKKNCPQSNSVPRTGFEPRNFPSLT